MKYHSDIFFSHSIKREKKLTPQEEMPFTSKSLEHPQLKLACLGLATSRPGAVGVARIEKAGPT